MDYLVAISAGFLAVLGAATLLGDILVKAKWPSRWSTKFSEERRSFLVLLFALALGSAAGAFAAFTRNRRKDALFTLFDLEVKLTQLEGLVHNALASVQKGDLSLLEAFRTYLNKYGSQIAQLLSRQSIAQLPATERKALDTGFAELRASLKTAVTGGTAPQKRGDALHTMLQAIGTMRAAVRKCINEIGSKS